MKAYAGIGSRETPAEVLSDIREIGCNLALMGWRLRSGAADGADIAFEEGHYDAMYSEPRYPHPEIYLPWASFNKEHRVMLLPRYYIPEPQEEAYEIASRFHHNWFGLKATTKALMARNVHQILGRDVTQPDLSKFVLCWTPGAEGGGGTGQALRIAKHYEIPIFDLADPVDHERVWQVAA